MLAYVLDASFVRTSVIESFSSLIWTERYDTLGDCELTVAFSLDMYSTLNMGTYLSVDESMYLMEIKSVSIDTDDDGGLIIKVIGESAERIFADRVSANLFAQNSTIRFEGEPGDIALDIARRSFASNPTEVFRENLLIGGKLDFTQGWTNFQVTCTTSVSNGVLTITPSGTSGWRIRGNVGDTDNYARPIEAGKSYLLQAETSKPVQFAITMEDGVGGPGVAFWTDSNNIITIPDDYAGQHVRFLQIASISGDTENVPVTVKNPTLEEYKGYVYNTPFNGSTPAANGVTYAWAGGNNNTSVLKNTSGTVLRRNLSRNPRTTKYNLVGKSKLYDFAPESNAWGSTLPVYSAVEDSTSPSNIGYCTRMSRASSGSITASGEMYKFTTYNNACPSASASKAYTASFYVRSSVAFTAFISIHWMNSSVTGISTVNSSSVSVPANTWTRLSYTATSPANTASALVSLRSSSAFSYPAGFTVDVEAFLFEQTSTVGSYFDGDYTTEANTTTAWEPVAKNWISTASGRVWTLPGTDSNYNVIFDNNQVGYKGTLAFPTDEVIYETDVDQTIKLLEDFCQSYGLGFSLTIKQLTSATRTFYFGIYKGTDRTTNQTAVKPVVFSKDFENLTNTSEIKSIANYKNVCVVSSAQGSVVVYADGINEGQMQGKELRVRSLKITDLNGIVDVPAYLRSCGVKALAQQQIVYALDGEISQRSQYVYGKDYFLGDIIEMRGENNVSNNMLVTEQTLIQDENGYRSYPTLTVNNVVTPGSWLSATGNLYWSAALGYWAAQP